MEEEIKQNLRSNVCSIDTKSREIEKYMMDIHA
jgi:hypothetical protein